MHATERTLANLGFAEIRKALEKRCRTEPGRQRALARPFLANASEVHDALSLIQEARRLLAEPLSLPLGGLEEIRPSLARAAKGAMLEPKELIAITAALFAFERVRETLEARVDALPMMAAIGRRIPALERLATRLDRCFEPNGELSDRASPELKEARDRARGLHRAIKSRLDKLLHDEKFLVNLREPYFTIRNDRYVLPVLAQMRAEVPGIVHNASQSGQTLFIEPQELIALGNDLAIAQSMVLEEERRILLELSGAVGQKAEEIAAGVEALSALDEAEAAARLANDLDGAPPEIDLDGTLELLSLRHPLLQLKGGEVVPNDVRLSGKTRALVVSGPNAGGKTVTLTAVGLCALMLRAGLPLPARAGSKLPLFSSIDSAIGDAQDLDKGLSTFSAHVAELKRICEGVAPFGLVLIDEICADTDPKEGAAIAIAVLEQLLDKGATVLVTTHLEELKALAHMDERFLNARVGFDPKRMAPTYKLQIGEAGRSSAIEIAARVGLSDRICARARELYLGAGGPLAKALAAAEEQRRNLDQLLEQARADREAAELAKRKHEEELAALEQRKKLEELRFRDALTAELEYAQRQVQKLLEALKSRESAKQAESAAQQIKARLEEQAKAVRALKAELARDEGPSGPPDLRVGGWVRHLGLDKDVEVLELVGHEVVVAAGALRMRVAKSEIGPARSARPSRFPSADRKAHLAKAEEVAPAAVALASPTVDVRGLRSDEAIRNVEQFLDRVFRGGENGATIIHGHGTGALKQTIRDYLDRSPYVRMYRPGDGHEGGDGVTVVSLKS